MSWEALKAAVDVIEEWEASGADSAAELAKKLYATFIKKNQISEHPSFRDDASTNQIQ